MPCPSCSSLPCLCPPWPTAGTGPRGPVLEECRRAKLRGLNCACDDFGEYICEDGRPKATGERCACYPPPEAKHACCECGRSCACDAFFSGFLQPKIEGCMRCGRVCRCLESNR
jgi:hypothetical protein